MRSILEINLGHLLSPTLTFPLYLSFWHSWTKYPNFIHKIIIAEIVLTLSKIELFG